MLWSNPGSHEKARALRSSSVRIISLTQSYQLLRCHVVQYPLSIFCVVSAFHYRQQCFRCIVLKRKKIKREEWSPFFCNITARTYSEGENIQIIYASYEPIRRKCVIKWRHARWKPSIRRQATCVRCYGNIWYEEQNKRKNLSKPGSYVEKIPDGLGFCCFPTVPAFAD